MKEALRRPVRPPCYRDAMTHDDDQRPAGTAESEHSGQHTGTELSNVDLQFMGRTDKQAEAEIDATVEAESRAPGEYQERGMDKQDVAVAQTMDASDPPSTNMGDEQN